MTGFRFIITISVVFQSSILCVKNAIGSGLYIVLHADSLISAVTAITSDLLPVSPATSCSLTPLCTPTLLVYKQRREHYIKSHHSSVCSSLAGSSVVPFLAGSSVVPFWNGGGRREVKSLVKMRMEHR